MSADSEPIKFQSRAERELEKKIVSWVYEQFNMMKAARAITERQWYLNIAFYFGRQWVLPINNRLYGTSASGASVKLYQPDAPKWRVRLVVNRIRPIVRTELAKLTSNKPTAVVVPSTVDDIDFFAAQAGEQLWNSTWDRKDIGTTLSRALWWTCVTGNGFIKSYWDPRETAPGWKEPGDFCYTHETPFNIFIPDLREQAIENQPFLFHVQARTPEYIQMRFGDVSTQQAERGTDVIEDSFIQLTGANKANKNKSMLVYEIWIKPGALPMLPQGGLFTIVGQHILQPQLGWPYKHGMYPFSHIPHIPTGNFYGESTITDLVPIQREFNRTRSQIVEAKNLMSKPKWKAPKGSVNASQITSEPGQVIEYIPGFTEPTIVDPPNLPAYVLQEIDRMMADFDDISGQHEVTRGRVPPGVTAATAINYLQEQDESKLSHTFDAIEKAIQKVGHQTLCYVGQYWTTERMVKVTGSDGSFDVVAFTNANLHDNTDLRVESGSALPTSRAAKQAFIMDLMKMGFIDPNKGLEVMEMGGVNKLYEQVRVDTRQAQRENLKMAAVTEEILLEHAALHQQDTETQIDPATGQPVPPEPPPLIISTNTWDDHRTHILVHNRYRKSQAFERLPKEARILFESHVQQHLSALAMEMQTSPLEQPVPGQEQEQEQGQPMQEQTISVAAEV